MLKTREKTNYVLVEDLTACEGDSSETLSILQLLKIAKNISAGMAYLNLKVYSIRLSVRLKSNNSSISRRIVCIEIWLRVIAWLAKIWL